jgi:hypothetical protein
MDDMKPIDRRNERKNILVDLLSFEKYLIHIYHTSVGGGVRRLLGDTADVSLANLNIAINTPG